MPTLTQSPIRDALSGAALIAIALYVIGEASSFRGNSGFLPTMLSFVMAGGGAILGLSAILTLLRGTGRGEAATPLTRERVLLPLAVFLATLGFILLIPRIGYYWGAALFIVAVMLILGIRSWIVTLATAGTFVLLLFAVFDVLLKVSFPSPSWF